MVDVNIFLDLLRLNSTTVRPTIKVNKSINLKVFLTRVYYWPGGGLVECIIIYKNKNNNMEKYEIVNLTECLLSAPTVSCLKVNF